MGDLKDDYAAIKEYWKEKKASNLDKSKKILNELGFKYKEFNGGIHLKVKGVDFWPSTGKWIDGKKHGRGVFNLIKRIKKIG